jgi:hypothetical protein
MEDSSLGSVRFGIWPTIEDGEDDDDDDDDDGFEGCGFSTSNSGLDWE